MEYVQETVRTIHDNPTLSWPSSKEGKKSQTVECNEFWLTLFVQLVVLSGWLPAGYGVVERFYPVEGRGSYEHLKRSGYEKRNAKKKSDTTFKPTADQLMVACDIVCTESCLPYSCTSFGEGWMCEGTLDRNVYDVLLYGTNISACWRYNGPESAVVRKIKYFNTKNWVDHPQHPKSRESLLSAAGTDPSHVKSPLYLLASAATGPALSMQIPRGSHSPAVKTTDSMPRRTTRGLCAAAATTNASVARVHYTREKCSTPTSILPPPPCYTKTSPHVLSYGDVQVWCNALYPSTVWMIPYQTCPPAYMINSPQFTAENCHNDVTKQNEISTEEVLPRLT